MSTYTPTAHYVTQVSPQDGATGLPRDTNVKVTFSEPMDPTDTSGSTYVLDPYGSSTGPLRADTQFEVELTTRVKDPQHGLYMSSPKIWHFKSAW